MGNNLSEDLKSLIGSYTTVPLFLDGQQYASKFVPEGQKDKAIIVTIKGEELFNINPSLLSDVLKLTPVHNARRKMFAKDRDKTCDVYKVDLEAGSFVDKRYESWKEDGITQLQDTEEIGFDVRNMPRIRTPKTYFATSRVLFLEFVNAPTFEQIVKKSPAMEEVLMNSFEEAGGLKYMLENCNDNKIDSILVETDPKTSEYKFILIDCSKKR